MKIAIADTNVRKIAELLAAHSYSARIVGGAVRDLIVGTQPHDIDLATDARPDDVLRIAEEAGHRVVPTGLQHGTVTIVLDGEGYEVTTLRRDVSTDGRHAEVDFVTDYQTDAARRDFTFNAMSASVDGEVFDYFGGIDDLQSRQVRFVGDARSRIEEDYLRILRFFRFRGRYGGYENQKDLQVIKDTRLGLERISVERIWSEVSKILTGPSGEFQLRDMKSLGLLDVIGMGFDVKNATLISSISQAGGRAATIIGALSSDVDQALDLAKRWKMSSAEMKDAIEAAIVANSPIDDHYYWIGMATDGMSPDRMIPVLMATGREPAAVAITGTIPEFPLKGRDLAGIVDPGPDMGAALSNAKEAWKNSNFTLTKDELLELASGHNYRRKL